MQDSEPEHGEHPHRRTHHPGRRSAALTERSRDFLELYWADVAQEFQPATGVRGGAETRVYKDAYLQLGTRQSTRPAAWLYGWHLGTWFSVGMIALAGASVLYDSQKIHRRRMRSDRYVAAALRLFASIAMMFWYTLRLMRRVRRVGG